MPDSLFDEPTDPAAPTADSTAPATDTAAPDPTATPAPATSAPAPAGYEAPWLEKAAGGKYKTVDAAAAEELQAKWKEIEPVIGAPKNDDGTPKEYAYELPEGVEFQPELVAKLNEFGRARNLSQSVMADAIKDVVLPWQMGLEIGQREAAKEGVVKFFGNEEKASAGLKEFFAHASAKLERYGETAVDDLRDAGAGDAAAAIRTMVRLRAVYSGATIGHASATGQAGLDHAAYMAILGTKDWQRDPKSVAAVTEYVNRVAPGDELPEG